MTIVLGTRGSRLALAQTEIVRQAIEQLPERPEVMKQIIKTTGDQRLDINLIRPGPRIDQGLFTRELEEALQRREIDVAVHSLKDLPTNMPDGIEVGARLAGNDPGDGLFSKTAKTLGGNPGSGTGAPSSLRGAPANLFLH